MLFLFGPLLMIYFLNRAARAGVPGSYRRDARCPNRQLGISTEKPDRRIPFCPGMIYYDDICISFIDTFEFIYLIKGFLHAPQFFRAKTSPTSTDPRPKTADQVRSVAYRRETIEGVISINIALLFAHLLTYYTHEEISLSFGQGNS